MGAGLYTVYIKPVNVTVCNSYLSLTQKKILQNNKIRHLLWGQEQSSWYID
jgi:hypothetical protein